MSIKVENSNWYKTRGGSVIFRGSNRSFGFISERDSLCRTPYWTHSIVINPRIFLEKVKSPNEILGIINRGLKLKHYKKEDLLLTDLKGDNHFKLEDIFINYHFDFNEKILVSKLMIHGDLFLKHNNGNKLLIMNKGKFPKRL